ncbi:MAG: hypothetical protein M3P29_01730 [Acidobacteriota bacterium]|nr:hypothetical protein [Acidobacteriota bacterium]
MTFNVIDTVILAAIAAESVLLAIGWRRRFHRASDRLTQRATAVLTLATASYLWLLTLFIWPHAAGPDYSDLRFLSIYINLAASLLATILAGVFGRGARVLLLSTTIWLLLLWLCAATLS